jgi:hypothetical protein
MCDQAETSLILVTFQSRWIIQANDSADQGKSDERSCEKQVRELGNLGSFWLFCGTLFLLGLIRGAHPKKIHAMGIDLGKTVFHC